MCMDVCGVDANQDWIAVIFNVRQSGKIVPFVS